MFGKLSGTTTIFTERNQPHPHPSASSNLAKKNLSPQQPLKHLGAKEELIKVVVKQPKTKLIVKEKRAKPNVLKEHE
jgi:hypothetical protein